MGTTKRSKEASTTAMKYLAPFLGFVEVRNDYGDTLGTFMYDVRQYTNPNIVEIMIRAAYQQYVTDACRKWVTLDDQGFAIEHMEDDPVGDLNAENALKEEGISPFYPWILVVNP